jgi:predicted transcriptional regulator of viral defense system
MKTETEVQLYQIAEDQAGYFSLAQAHGLGLRRHQIYREIQRGKFIRTEQGVYRFVQFPASQFEEVHRAVLSAGLQAVVGFQTALYVYELSDLIPDEIHLILPPTSSRRRPGIQVHTIQLLPEDVTDFDGLPITTFEKTIVDCVFTHVENDQIRLAIYQTLQRGMTSKQKLTEQAAKRSVRNAELVARFIEEVS